MRLKVTHGLFIFLILAAAFMVSARELIDVDVWWHIVLGREMFASFSPPDFGHLYFGDINPNVNDLRYTWLGDVLLYLAYQWGSVPGLQLLRLACVLLSAFLVWDMMDRKFGAPQMTILLMLLLCTYQLQLVRNAIFSLPLIVALYWIWWRCFLKDERKNTSNLMWSIPLLLTCWSLIHGTYLVGCIVLLFLLLGETYAFLRNYPDLHSDSKSNHRKKKSKHAKTETLDSDQEIVVRRVPFDHLRQAYICLFLSFIGTTAYNGYSFNLLTAKFGNSWLVGAALVALALVISFHPKVGNRLVNYRRQFLLGYRAIISVTSVSFIYWLLRRSFENAHSTAQIDLRSVDMQPIRAGSGLLHGLKVTLNDMLFEQTDHFFVSTDFLSPWDHVGEIYIYVTFVLVAATLVGFAIRKPLPASLTFVFVPVVLLGFSYKRTVGYLGITCLVMLAVWLKNADLRRMRVYFRIFNSFIICALVAAISISPKTIGMWETHVFGLGKAPYFSNECADYVLKELKEDPLFTTISSGGYLLKHFYPNKRVFVDGFFAPHMGRSFATYRSALMERNPDILFETFEIEHALVSHRDVEWLTVFSASEHWYPLAVDEGMVLFSRCTELPVEFQVKMLLPGQVFDQVPSYFRTMLANRILEIPSILVTKGFPEHADRFMKENHVVIQRAKQYGDLNSVAQLAKNIDYANRRYQGKNSRQLKLEFQFQYARSTQDHVKASQYGIELWSHQKDIEMGSQLSQSCLDANRLDLAKLILLDIYSMRTEHPNDWDRYRPQTVSCWKQIAKHEELGGDYVSAYVALKQISLTNEHVLNGPQLVQKGLDFYSKLRESDETIEGWILLTEIHADYAQSPHVLHNLSAHIFEHHKELGFQLDLAADYGEQAVKLALLSGVTDMDLLYKNLADIYQEMGRFEQAQDCLESAIRSAPEARKPLYSGKQP